MQKPRSSQTGAFGYTLFSDTGALGGFVAFIECHCYFLNTVLLWYRLQIMGPVWYPDITSPTQFDGTNEAVFFRYFLYCHWLVGLGSWPFWWR